MAQLKKIKNSGQELYGAHKHYIPVIAFIGGLVFDAFTLRSFDSIFTLAKHGTYLAIITVLLGLEFLESEGKFDVRKLGKVWTYHEEAVHFLFGSLLSAFSVFYFKSSSLMTSFVFMVLILLFLVLNELPKFRMYGIIMRSALLTLCLSSYAIYAIPVVLGEIGILPFLLAIGATAFYLVVFWFGSLKFLGAGAAARKMILVPGIVVLGLLTGMYFLKVIPPVPLSMKYIGIYHKVSKVGTKYVGEFDRPWWKVWHNGDQDFTYRSGDLIYCYFSIVSPGGFADKLRVRWLYKNPQGDWRSSDAIPVSIYGGRKEGYRGYTHKRHYQDGDWQVRVETSDGREVGRIYLTISPDITTDKRVFITQEI